MGQYKVPQNVESEDKILGPLTIKQFIYIIIALMWGFLCWRIFGAALPIAIILMLPVSGPLLALGLIQREGQSFETYFIALIRYIIVPRKRSWLKDVTKVVIKKAPPKVVVDDGRPDINEVRGELRKLASIVDSRGRIPKGAELQAPDANVAGSALSQRVITPPAEMVASEIISAKVSAPRNDMLDMQHNPQAVAVGKQLKEAEVAIHEQALGNMKQALEQPQTAAAAPQAQVASQPQTQNAILQRAAESSSVLSVQQLAQQVKRQSVLQEGQAVQIRQ